MKKTILIAFICLGLFLSFYFWFTNPTNSNFTNTSLQTIPVTSLEENVCDKVSEQSGDCKKVLLYDTQSHLVFVESSSEIYPLLTNNEFTEVQQIISPMNFQEFNEEKVERGPIDWRAANNVEKKFSVIYGFAEDTAKTIVINSEGNIQPNRFFVRENLWVWYATFPKDKVNLPVQVSVYNANGQMIYGGDENQ